MWDRETRKGERAASMYIETTISIVRHQTAMPLHPQDLPQQMVDTTAMYFVVILPNTMMSFWNMRTASAAIQHTEASVK